MQVATIYCPSCGAALDVQPSITSLSCAYCGTSLVVRRDAAGKPQLLLQGISTDTELLAASIVRDRLRERLQQLAVQSQMLAEKIQKESEDQASKREAARSSTGQGWLIVAVSLGLLFMFAATGVPGLCIGIALLGVLLGAAIVAANRIPARLKQQYEDTLRALASQHADLEREALTIQQQLHEVEARIDHLTDAFIHRSTQS